MIIAGLAYLHNDREISCLDRNKYVRIVQEKRQLQRELATIRKQLTAKKKPTKSESATLQKRVEAIGQQTQQLDIKQARCVVWRSKCDFTIDMILTATALVTGGENQVIAYSIKDGTELWRAKVNGNAYGLAAANGQLFVSTDKGTIHCFAPSMERTR